MARKTLILTGASRGIGHATVKKFSQENWRVISCSRDDIPSECQRDPNWVMHYPMDLSIQDNVENLIQKIKKDIDDSPVTALINNAAISPKNSDVEQRLGCLETSIEEWRSVFELNFFTPLILARGFLDHLKKAKGTIINVTSIAGHIIHPFAGSAYSTSKAALSALTREMAAEFAPYGVRVNAVAPGEIKTSMLSKEYDQLIPNIPMKRFGTPEEVASILYQLCTQDFNFVTGSEVFITGGQHLY